MAEDTTFGKAPGQLRRLLLLGRDEAEEKEPIASWDLLAEKPGSQIGRYKLVRVLGEGGMGIAYLAEQQQPIRRQVALKAVKPGMDSKRVIARFEAERQALALLDHPNIAHVYDAGTTESGRPYFVMEYVEGVPITEYCDHQQLSIDDRLRLFQQVCLAVHHAHQKGIIHRDIKPSNILVAVEGDKAIPKIIDFGVAKAIAEPLTEQTLRTEDSQLLGTPEYMSPEQAGMAGEDIDTRSDIYSLGVLLYVLLTGALPFDATDLRQGGVEHVRRVIRETDPKTPSTRLTSLGQEAEEVAKSRRTEVIALAKCLRRELEWIPLKAMRQDRAERYRSAAELADDVENYLNGEPLIAGPLATGYRLKKFVRRNRMLVGGIATVLVVLAVGVVVSVTFAIGQARARVEAQALSDVLENTVLKELDPYRVGGREITIQSVWDALSQDIEGKLTETPLAEAAIRNWLGMAYWSLGLYDLSELHYLRCVEIYRAHLGPDHPTTLARMKNLGWVYHHNSRYDEGERLVTETLRRMERVLDQDDGQRLHTMVLLANLYAMHGRFDEAERLSVTAFDVNRRKLGEEHPFLVDNMLTLAWVYCLQGRYDEAEKLGKRGLRIVLREEGGRAFRTLMMKRDVGMLHHTLGRYVEAEESMREALAGWQNVWGQEHKDTLKAMAALGWLYHSQGRYEQAEALFAEALGIARRVLHETHITTADCIHGLASVYLSQGKHDEAEPLLEEALKIANDLLGEKNWPALRVMNTLAKLYTAQSRYDDAERLFRETLKARTGKLGDDHPDTLETMNGFGVLRREQKRYEEAESMLRQALEGRQRKLGPKHPACFESKHELALVYVAREDYDKAELLLLDAFQGRETKLGPNHPHTIASLRELVRLYESWPKPDEAEKYRAKLASHEAVKEAAKTDATD